VEVRGTEIPTGLVVEVVDLGLQVSTLLQTLEEVLVDLDSFLQ
jgi:hypothetical protein